jgi:transposase
MNLSEVEAAFRSMKTELGTRPIYHQKDGRIEVHLFYSILAYAILKSITYKLAKHQTNPANLYVF